MKDLTNLIPNGILANSPSEIYIGKYGVCQMNGKYKLITGVYDKRTSSGFRVKTIAENDDLSRFSELIKDYFNKLK